MSLHSLRILDIETKIKDSTLELREPIRTTATHEIYNTHSPCKSAWSFLSSGVSRGKIPIYTVVKAILENTPRYSCVSKGRQWPSSISCNARVRKSP